MWPTDFQRRIAQLYGAATATQLLATMHRPKAIVLWDNPLRLGGLDALAAALGTPIKPVGDPALPGVGAFDARHRDVIMRHPLVTSGAIYPINPSSLVAAQALEVQRNDEVLDLAAAPGGKCLVLAANLTQSGQATGRLAAVEAVKPRFHRLRANLERCGVLQVDYYLRDGRGVGRAVPERFDRVLLDAPCSSEARFHADAPGSADHWSLRKVRDCARKQRGLLESAFRALKPGGSLVYCTCAFAPEENEQVVAWLLRRHASAFIEGMPELGIPPALIAAPLQQWAGRSISVAPVVRVLPDDLWDGFFMVRLGKR